MIKKTILVIDDVPDNITFINNLLSDEFIIKASTNAKTALRILQNAPYPDLILLDVVMPEVNGYDLCKTIKENILVRDIPIIFVTSNTSPDEITRGFISGGVDYVTKPYNPNELKARISTHLKLKDSIEKMRIIANKLGKYLPAEVYASIFSGDQDVKVQATKKYLTVCFTDIINFSEISESITIDELTTRMNKYMNKMAEITVNYGGTLDKFIGDAVMIFFGDPKSKGEDEDARLCVEMAKEMIIESNKMDINLRIGINSGECIVGNFGSENRMDYTIMGRVVNAAKRLETASEENKILISDSTYKHILGEESSTVFGEIHVKGIKDSIKTYLVD